MPKRHRKNTNKYKRQQQIVKAKLTAEEITKEEAKEEEEITKEEAKDILSLLNFLSKQLFTLVDSLIVPDVDFFKKNQLEMNNLFKAINSSLKNKLSSSVYNNGLSLKYIFQFAISVIEKFCAISFWEKDKFFIANFTSIIKILLINKEFDIKNKMYNEVIIKLIEYFDYDMYNSILQVVIDPVHNVTKSMQIYITCNDYVRNMLLLPDFKMTETFYNTMSGLWYNEQITNGTLNQLITRWGIHGKLQQLIEQKQNEEMLAYCFKINSKKHIYDKLWSEREFTDYVLAKLNYSKEFGLISCWEQKQDNNNSLKKILNFDSKINKLYAYNEQGFTYFHEVIMKQNFDRVKWLTFDRNKDIF